MFNAILKIVIGSFIFFILVWHLALPLNLTIIDLGRHIKNGDLIMHGIWDVLYKNYYSNTFSEYHFINHHWFFGVISYLIWSVFGFTGIAIFFVCIKMLILFIFFQLAERFSSFYTACSFTLLSFPLIIARTDIRPDVFSMLFSGLFWWFLDSFSRKCLTSKKLKFWLIFIQIVWVNTHIFFIMGPVLVTFFWLQAKITGNKEEFKVYRQTLWLVLGACLVNPSALLGALTPLNILKGFNVPLAENYPIFQSFGIITPFLWKFFIISFGILSISWVLLIQKQVIRQNLLGVLLVVFFSLSAVSANRLISTYGHFWIPLLSYSWYRLTLNCSSHWKNIAILMLIVVGIFVSIINLDYRHKLEFGLTQGVNSSGESFKKKGLHGPIFNNYNIGGYLIYHLSPQQKLFVDNRAEAFPKEFLQKIYLPMLYNNEVWLTMDRKYQFNSIFLATSKEDVGGFIFNRLQDNIWAPVYLDENVIILLKRNNENAQVISQYECRWALMNSNTQGFVLRQDTTNKRWYGLVCKN